MGLHCQITLLLMVLAASVTTTLAFVLADSQCVVPAPCDCTSNRVNCNNKALTGVPTFTAISSIDYIPELTIRLENNSITTIPANVFQHLSSVPTSVIRIILHDNVISNIDLAAFSGLENKLSSLDLRNNKLTSLPPALSHLNKLNVLYIVGNPIVSLDSTILLHLSQYLTKFSLNMEALSDWPAVLSSLKLQNLRIENMSLKKLPLNAFAGSESGLTILELQNTKLARIPHTVCQLQNLQALIFTHNMALESNMTLIEPCSRNLTHLTHMDLRLGDLYAFPDVMWFFPSLTRLYLYKNKISIVDTNAIPDFNRLKLLDMQANKLTSIPSALNKLKHLKILYLAENQITTIENHDLVGLTELGGISLNNNPIQFVSPLAFKNNLKLTNIRLDNTRLHLIPEYVRYLPKLVGLEFSNNSADCSCSMSYLKGWDVTNVAMYGNVCRQPIDIKKFILEQLQRCP